MATYELMSMHMIDKKGNHLFGKNVVPYDEDGMPSDVDSNSCTIGSAREIIKYLLKGELSDYKLVKRKRKGKLH